MKPIKPIPPWRSYEQIKNHYLVEKSIAERLKKSNREERQSIYTSMYQELFDKIPDHPRLVRRESKKLSAIINKNKLCIANKYINQSIIFLEFAPGDCRFLYNIANKVKFAYGVDISDQRGTTTHTPDNFKLLIYNGYDLNEIEDNSIDVVFSDQLIEHLHPEDTFLHFKLVHRILKKGGKYIFRTPHSLQGPCDVSQYFSNFPECFHLKEWKYYEIKKILEVLQYSSFYTYWNAREKNIRLPSFYFIICERILERMPKKNIRNIAKYLIPTLCATAIK